LAKKNKRFVKEMGYNMEVLGTHLNPAGLLYSLVPCLQLLLYSVKYEHEEIGEHQQTKELSGENNIFV